MSAEFNCLMLLRFLNFFAIRSSSPAIRISSSCASYWLRKHFRLNFTGSGLECFRFCQRVMIVPFSKDLTHLFLALNDVLQHEFQINLISGYFHFWRVCNMATRKAQLFPIKSGGKVLKGQYHELLIHHFTYCRHCRLHDVPFRSWKEQKVQVKW